ncbi:MAG: sugar kinase [Oscillospiraceae bacterium]|nr:sugar kinase [Oscillospiraceae bacterium]
MLDLRTKHGCLFDEISLGEVMLRLDPGEGRIKSARAFRAWEGGGEYNVARGLRRCFGLRTAIITAFAENEIGALLEDLILQGGVDTRFIQWKPFDGIGRTARNGLNFTERGFGPRAALGVSDRAYTAVSQLKPGDIDWEHIFGTLGARWFHTGGIFAALSETTAALTLEALECAKKHGTVTSYDLNYRPSLWKERGGQARAREVNAAILPYIDVLFGNEEDFTACLGFEIEGSDASLKELSAAGYERMLRAVAAAYPHLKLAAASLRGVKTATRNDWSAIAFAGGTVYTGMALDDLEIFDRVGGGDSFASGLIYGLLSEMTIPEALDYGIAHGALAMTTPGDTSMASFAEVKRLVDGGSARVLR